MTLLSIEDVVSGAGEIPSLPTVAFRVMRETDRSDSSAASVGKLIHEDPALASRVLRLANSSFYGLARRVSDVSEAVVVLGMRSVRSICMVAAAYPLLSRQRDCYRSGEGGLWTRAYATAIGAQMIATRTRCVADDVAFTAGLLHDLGKLVTSVWLDAKLNGMVVLAVEDEKTFDDLERQIVGFDHAQVGGFLADSWNLPPAIANAIRYHHHPSDSPQPATDCVHVADYLGASLGIGLGADGLLYSFDASALERLGIDPDDLDRLTDDMGMAMRGHSNLMEALAA